MSTQGPPNILWLCTDSQRWDTLGCYGNEFVHTPNLDALAERGTRFDRCYTQNTLCTPSRGAMLTGRYPSCTGLTKNGHDIDEREVLVPRLLADHGYRCGLSGKLHLSAVDHRLQMHGEEWWRHGSKEDYDRGLERRINDGYHEFYWDHGPTGRPESLYTQWYLKRGGDIDHLKNARQHTRDDCPYVLEGVSPELHQTTFCSEMCIDFVERHANRPWFFSLNCKDPHFAFKPPREYFERYLPFIDDIPLPDHDPAEFDNKPPFQRDFAHSGAYRADQISDRDHRMMRAAYWAMIDFIDVQFGRIFSALEATGQMDNTIIVFSSDHGELLGDHGIYTKGPFWYDPACRVPLIIAGPNIHENVSYDGVVQMSDLAPSAVEWAGLPKQPGMQMQSLQPILDGTIGEAEFREDAYGEYYDSNFNKPSQYCTMLVNRTHKLVKHHDQELSELYDLETDPAEMINRWNDPAYRDIRQSMMERLCDRMAMTVDPLPERVGLF